MQETGSNIRKSEKILSIRLSPNGLSFWLTDTAVIPENNLNELSITSPANGRVTIRKFSTDRSLEENVAIEMNHCMEATGAIHYRPILYLDTEKSVLVPAELFQKESAANYLALHNIPCREEETVILSPVVRETVAIMVCNKAVFDQIVSRTGEGLTVLSPFQYNLIRTGTTAVQGKPYLRLYLCPGRIYITAFDATGKQRYNDVLPISSVADVIYYLHRLGKTLPIAESHLYIKGVNAAETFMTLRRYYKFCQCE